MSEIPLATRYAASNYPIALNNLAKRYQREGDGEAIHYSELAFGDVSDQQAKTALRFFANIELLENPKGANYIPPDSVVDWQVKMGDTAKEGKKEVYNQIQENYDVFNELVFILKESEEDLDELAEQVGGLVGIDEDEISDMKKTIDVFAECGFLDIDGENTVRLVDEFKDESSEEEPIQTSLEEAPNTNEPKNKTEEQVAQEPQPSVDPNPTPTTSQSTFDTEVEITIDATEMDPQDLKKKLEIIDEIAGYDGE